MKTRIPASLILTALLLTGQAHGMAKEKKGGNCWKTAAKHTAGVAATSLAAAAFTALAQSEKFQTECIQEDGEQNWIRCSRRDCTLICIKYLTGSPSCAEYTSHCYTVSQLYSTTDDAWQAYLDPFTQYAIPMGVILYTMLRCVYKIAS